MRVLLFSVLLLATGCKKFLDARPDTSTVNPTTIVDFRQMLNSDSLATCNFILADLSSDDVHMTDGMLSQDPTSYYAHAYLWAGNIWNPGDQDFMYNAAYQRILQMNLLLSRLDNASGTVAQKDTLRGQAMINRAWYYLELANLYGPDYQAATAATDLAVPLVLTPDANLLPSRATVQQVYAQILQDLQTAVAAPGFPGMGDNIVLPGRASGFALLARTYLYMENYPDALAAADSSLAINNRLWNYSDNYATPVALTDLSKNPEVLLGRLCSDVNYYGEYYTSFLVSTSLGAVLDSNDTRLLKNFDNGGGYNTSFTSTLVCNYSVGVPEVMLTKAECLARQGDGNDALTLVNQLRQNRLVNYAPITDMTDVLDTVLQERRRELFYHGGLRLFDLKRLNRDNQRAQTLQRISDDGTTVLATLPTLSPRYLMQFSPLIINNNPNIVQNPR